MINTGLEDGGDNLGDVERKKVDLGIDNALDQSFFCLYGLNLKCGLDTSNEDDLAVHRNTSLGDYQTKEQCADVFKYLLPYAKASSVSILMFSLFVVWSFLLLIHPFLVSWQELR